MDRKYRLYFEDEVQDLLRDRKVNHPPVTCYNRLLRVSMDYLSTADVPEIEKVFRKQSFWGNRCECCDTVIGDSNERR